jgi:hypothetical protein
MNAVSGSDPDIERKRRVSSTISGRLDLVLDVQLELQRIL